MCPHHFLFFFNDTATTEIYTLSLHDALPIYFLLKRSSTTSLTHHIMSSPIHKQIHLDRKSTRLNSSHPSISYAVFCLKKKKYKRTNYFCSHRFAFRPNQNTYSHHYHTIRLIS